MLYIINMSILFLFNLVKEKKVWFTLPLIVVLITKGGLPDPYTTVDYLAYESEYNNKYLGFVSRFEWLYQDISSWAVKHSLTYSQFRVCLITVTFIILFIAVRRLTKNDKFFWLLFALFPFFPETVQVRSFAMIALVLLAISFLKANKIQSYIVSAVLIFLGTGFHTSGYIFFLVLPIQFFFAKRWSVSLLRRIFLLFLVSSMFVSFMSTTGLTKNIMNLVQSVSGNDAVAENVNNIYSAGASISSVLLVFSFTLFFLLVMRIFGNSKIALDENIRVIFSFLTVTCVGMPLVMISSQYDRILREGIIGLIILLSIVFVNKKILNKYFLPIILLYFIVTYIFMGGYRLSDGFLNMFHYIGF